MCFVKVKYPPRGNWQKVLISRVKINSTGVLWMKWVWGGFFLEFLFLFLFSLCGHVCDVYVVSRVWVCMSQVVARSWLWVSFSITLSTLCMKAGSPVDSSLGSLFLLPACRNYSAGPQVCSANAYPLTHLSSPSLFCVVLGSEHFASHMLGKSCPCIWCQPSFFIEWRIDLGCLLPNYKL